MISFIKRGDNYNIPIMEIYGLSTDEKPKFDLNGSSIPNGSIFFEMDTLDVFFYDTEKDDWI